MFASDTEASGNNSEWTTVDSSKSAKPQPTSGDNTREPSTPEQESAKCQPVNDEVLHSKMKMLGKTHLRTFPSYKVEVFP